MAIQVKKGSAAPVQLSGLVYNGVALSKVYVKTSPSATPVLVFQKSGKNLTFVVNWGANKNKADIDNYFTSLFSSGGLVKSARKKVIICPPSCYDNYCYDKVNNSQFNLMVGVGAQIISPYANGAYSGQVSASQSLDSGCSYALINTYSQQQNFPNLYHNDLIKNQINLCLGSGITPLVFVGDTEAEREAGTSLTSIQTQLTEYIGGLEAELVKNICLVYQPKYSSALTSELIVEILNGIFQKISDLYGLEVALAVKILYGGFINNISSLWEMDKCSGYYVDNTSAQNIINIVNNA